MIQNPKQPHTYIELRANQIKILWNIHTWGTVPCVLTRTFQISKTFEMSVASVEIHFHHEVPPILEYPHVNHLKQIVI